MIRGADLRARADAGAIGAGALWRPTLGGADALELVDADRRHAAGLHVIAFRISGYSGAAGTTLERVEIIPVDLAIEVRVETLARRSDGTGAC